MSESWEYRFSGVQRIYGKTVAERLPSAHALVMGVGGVGSWAAEALVRTGIGNITLVDFDDICLSNSNRQIQATTESVGKMKTTVLKERFLSINPELKVTEVQEIFSEQTAQALLASIGNAVILDCMDSLSAKCFLIDHCYKNEHPLVVVGGSAGKLSPEMVKVDDLARTYGDRLLHKLRKRLRTQHGFPRDLKKKWQIPAVFSDESPVYPLPDGSVSQDVEARPHHRFLDCNEGMGSLCFLTGSFGFFAASEGLKLLATFR